MPSISDITVVESEYPIPVLAACSDVLNWNSFSTTIGQSTSEVDTNLKLRLDDIPIQQVVVMAHIHDDWRHVHCWCIIGVMCCADEEDGMNRWGGEVLENYDYIVSRPRRFAGIHGAAGVPALSWHYETRRRTASDQ